MKTITAFKAFTAIALLTLLSNNMYSQKKYVTRYMIQVNERVEDSAVSIRTGKIMKVRQSKFYVNNYKIVNDTMRIAEPKRDGTLRDTVFIPVQYINKTKSVL